MAGGNWVNQNKTLPGVYTNYSGQGANPSVTGDRGTVALPITFPWLEPHKVIKLIAADAVALAAQHAADSLLIREAAKKAKTLLLYRLNQGAKASATVGNLTATALYAGTYGNRLSVSVAAVAGSEGSYYVITWLDTDEVDRQAVTTIAGLTDNDYVTFAGTDALAANAGVPLAGGADGTVTLADHVAALAAFETQAFDALACPFADVEVKALYTAYCKRLVNDEGKYIQAVVSDYPGADFEGVISVKNGVVLEDGTTVNAVQATAYIAAATAACPLNASLTNADYIGSVDVTERYTVTEQSDLAKSGQLVFLPPDSGRVAATIQKDINTLTSFSDTKTYALSKNKIIRTLFTVCNDINSIANNYFKGKVTNDADGRALFKSRILTRFRELEDKQRAIQDVVPEDITVAKGELLDAVVVDYVIRPADVMETFYNSITVEA
ncbi:MAG: phage tail sheath family protein [Candidatus Fimivivens sp.]